MQLASDKDEEATLIWRIYREEKTKDSIAMSRALGDFVYKNQPHLPADEQMVSGNVLFCIMKRASGTDAKSCVLKGDRCAGDHCAPAP